MECLESPGALAKLRRSCHIAKKCFDKNQQIEIKVCKLYGTIDLKMILNKSDYEKACSDLFKKISMLIKEIIKRAKLSEINIDNILLIGSTSRTDKIKSILKELFKHNRLLYNKISLSLSSDGGDDFYIVIGAAIQSMNLLTKEEPKYILSDLTPISFGVEIMNGLMEFVIENGTKIPVQKEKFVKIKNLGEEFLEIKIYEGEDNNANKNKFISSANIKKIILKQKKMEKILLKY
jgi:molecular chaperone DnaK